MPTPRPPRTLRAATRDPNPATTPPATSIQPTTNPLDRRELVLAISPFGRPDARVTAAAVRAGALGVLDLGQDRDEALAALEDTARWARGPFGVRVGAGCPLLPSDLPDAVDTVVLAPDAPWQLRDAGPGRRVLLEVTSPDEVPAPGSGADGLVARGSESGGLVGDLSTFVLLQRLVAGSGPGLPVWAAGGIGLHTAAAAIAGGAAGVVLDVQLALTSEARENLPRDIAAALRAMDGSETAVVEGRRVYSRPGPELTGGPLPVGQDGAFAGGLAERYRTVGGIVQAVRSSIRQHLVAAQLSPPLTVAQGPMTRVSDRVAFAGAVTAEGGLPFLALALMRGHEVATLLAEATEKLHGQQWGVGILGFVPPELREAQLEVVRSVRPPFALIAGGRPAQAAALEADGIPTYLHVPSPGLLDRFLADGARRFVFEGSECGGHIGPRASFPLWEAQVEHLLSFGDDKRHGGASFYAALNVLFAGGIHDERSAAMVAAAAAPLAERGATIGVLMGTAYLFTREAVEAGAILEGFQAAAVSCDRTVLLETSPGHITRCADTPYVAAFKATKDRLTDAGATQQEMWAELEKLNLGRLRIASKGLRRDDGRLVDVTEDEQQEAGMYMLGQVATLRSEPTSIAGLHRQVTSGAAGFLSGRAADLGLAGDPVAVTPEQATPLDIAVVGMACVMPNADGLASYWANILAGVDAVTEVPSDRWNAGRYYDAETYSHNAGRTSPSKWGGFIPPVPFDALAYGIPPSSLSAIEPVQLLALEVASRALADAGYANRPFDRSRASAVFGAEGGTDLAAAYTFGALAPSYFGDLPPELEEHLPTLTEDSFPGVLANVIAGRIANRLDLGGVNYTVDAACASSLAALDVACKELTFGASDLVLCGGADLHNGIYDYLMFTAAHALSPGGRCRSFDAAADGITLGEGVVCVVLKRLADAERDGDRVYAVVKAVAGSSDGKSLGLTAPRPEGQRLALERAYRMAGVSPAAVGLVEAHGTGTVVGDRTELGVLNDVFTEAGAPPGSCVLGSVKSQIGHTKCAAGIAGLVKAAYALHAGVRPPTGPIKVPNPGWEASTSPFFFDQQARPWAAAPGERYAGVSAFGFGGTNFHAVLSGYDGAPEPVFGVDEWPAELFCFRGIDGPSAVVAIDKLAALLVANDAAGRPLALGDLAAGVGANRGTAQVQVALVADSLDDLARKLPGARELRSDAQIGIFAADSTGGGPVAFLFPGQGSQRPAMLADLFVAFPRLQRHLRGSAAPYATTMFPPASFTPEGLAAQREAVTDTRVAQPVMGIAGSAVSDLLGWLGVRPDMAGGHSYGEVIALASAGALRQEDLLALSEHRAAVIVAAAGDDPGTMAAVTADATTVRRALAAAPAGVAAPVVIANYNAPEQVVISGPSPAVAAAVKTLEGQGLVARLIPVACAFHSPVVATAEGAFAQVLESHELAAPSYPVWSNMTAAPYPDQPAEMRRLLAGQLANPVRFVEQVEAMYDAGARVFVESGPGRVLTGLVGKILGDRAHTAVACDAQGEPGLRRLLFALAELAAAGVPVDVAKLFHGRRVTAAREVPARPGWIVDGHTVRTAAGNILPGGLHPTGDLLIPIAAAAPAAAPAPVALAPASSQHDAVVLEFLRSTRELIAAQKEVMLGFLGTSSLPEGNGIVDVGVALPAGPVAPAPVTVAEPTLATEPEPVADAGVAPLTEESLLEVILGIVGQRTGYPMEMLGAEMDLEADLSIDSIKRTEIIMELAEHMRLHRGGVPVAEGIVEQLARLKTIGSIVAWIVEHMGASIEAPAPVAATSPVSAAPAVAPAVTREAAAVEPTHRYVVEPAPARLATTPADISGKRFVVVDEGEGVGAATAAALRARGADALLLAPHHVLESSCASVDGLVHVAALRPGQDPILPEAFAAIRAAVVGGAAHLLVAIGSEDPVPGLGVAGLVRTIAREYPNVSVRAVEVDTSQRPAHVAEQLAGELAVSGDPFVSYRRTARTSRRVVESPLAAAQPTGVLLRAIEDLGLGPDSVVVFTGGGRGITATCAIALARAAGCHIEILGRTPSPDRPEHPDIAAALDRPSLRQALLGQGVGTPAQVEAAMRRILATREVRATLETLTPLCASVRYHSVDVCDPEAVGRVINEINDRWERIDGVIHGAGVLEDKMLVDKTPESFARVFGTKVDGARALVSALEGRQGLRFLVLFGSVSGVFGNPGQVDYSAANDALDTLARLWNGRLPGRVVSIDWGPWASAGGGMVSPELEREYTRRGISMIAPEDGVAALFGELAWGERETCQAVYMAGGGDSAAAFAGGEVTAPASVRARARAASAAAPAEAGEKAETTLRFAGGSPAEVLSALELHELDPTGVPGVPGDGTTCRLAIVDPTPERFALARKVIQRGSPWRGRNDVWFTNRPLLADGRIAFLFPGFEPEPLGNVDEVADSFGLPRPSIAGTGELVDQAVDIVAMGRLLAGALERLGITPDLLAGHSLGEWTAMIVSGMWRPEDGEHLDRLFRIGKAKLPDAAYAALGCSAEQAAAAIGTLDGIVVSHDNCPHQSVVCGRPEQVDTLLATLRERGVLGQVVPFRSGFHSPMMAGFLDGNRPAFDALSLRQPWLPVWSATSVAPYPTDPPAVRDLVLRHLLEPVRFRELVEAMYRDGARAFVQVGTGSLMGFVQDTLGAREHLAIAALSTKHSGLAQLDRVAAALWVEGMQSSEATPSGGGGGFSSPVRARTATLIRPEAAVATQVLTPLAAPLTPSEARVLRTPRVFSLDTVPELMDHCLAPQAPGWPDATDAFPVVPMTTLLEVMAEAAVARYPARTVVGFRGVRALRWLVVAPPATTIVETHEEADGYVRVKIEGYAEGLVHLAGAYPEAPAPAGWTLTGARAPLVDAAGLYGDGWMFHGPRFAGVREITAYGDDGIRGVIETLAASGALLDCAGQLAGHWAQVTATVDRSAFPTNIGTVSLFGPHPTAGTRVECDVTIREFTADTLRCDLEVRSPDGGVWARIDGWTCRRFASDDVVFPALHTQPSRAAIGQAQPGGWCLVTDRWPDQASQEMVMRRYMNAVERAEYEARNPRARRAWLLGRIAAKDAARHLLWGQGRGELFPAEISMGNDAEGRPWLRGPGGMPMAVSLAHTSGFGVAIVLPSNSEAGPDLSAGLGIDVEALGAVTEAVATVSFTPEELALVDGPAGGRRAWLTRFWCAKEAVAKAEGTGLAGRPRDFVVTGVTGETLTVTAHERTYRVATCILEDSHVVAWTMEETI